jgi:hypothetical protein
MARKKVKQTEKSSQGIVSPLMRKRLDALGKALGSAMAEDLEEFERKETRKLAPADDKRWAQGGGRMYYAKENS